jgi:hypothetical protein
VIITLRPRGASSALSGRPLADAERALGAGHPLTGTIRRNLAGTIAER